LIEMSSRILVFMVGATFIVLTGLGHAPGLVHGYLMQGGCGGNVPVNQPLAGCSSRPLPNEVIQFQTPSGLTLGQTRSAGDGSYNVLLPGGRYRMLSPALGTNFTAEVTVIEWWSVRANICLCAEVP